ncbi:hypothetical protein ACFE04_011155 [Oxalis oulophora]
MTNKIDIMNNPHEKTTQIDEIIKLRETLLQRPIYHQEIFESYTVGCRGEKGNKKRSIGHRQHSILESGLENHTKNRSENRRKLTNGKEEKERSTNHVEAFAKVSENSTMTLP